MSTKVTLPSGFTATIREAKHVRYGAWEDLEARLNDETPSTAPYVAAYRRGLLALGVTAWDVRDVDDDGQPTGDVLPLPSADPEVLRKLPGGDVAVLFQECRKLESALAPDFGPDPSPQSPTTPSGA